MMRATSAGIVTIALIGATLSPIVRSPEDDGFPLSTFPMFAVHRPTIVSLAYAVGVTKIGGRRTLTPRLIGSSQVLQASALVERAMDGGPPALAPLCAAIAGRVALDRDYPDVATIEIVLGTHDVLGYFVRGETGQENVHARCEVAP